MHKSLIARERENPDRLRHKLGVASFHMECGQHSTIINIDVELCTTLYWMMDSYRKKLDEEDAK